MPCTQGNHLNPLAGNGEGPHLPGAPTNPTGRTLIVSNAPETIIASTSPTWYQCEVPLTAGVPRLIRSVFWHLNGTRSPITGNIWLSLSEDTEATVTDFVVETSAPTLDFGALGLCLAKVQLYQTFNAPVDLPDELSNAELPIASYSIGAGLVKGALLQFAVTADASCNLRFRTGSGGNWESEVADAGDHIRGWWPKSEITLPFPTTIDANPDLVPRYAYAGVCELNGPEVSEPGFAPQDDAIDPYGKANKGLYGANASYVLTATNCHPSLAGTVAIYAQIRQNTLPLTLESKYWGAGKIWAPAGFSNLGIPVLRYYDPEHNHNSTDNQVPMGSVHVPSGGGTTTIVIKVANACAAALPFNLKAVTVPPPP